MTSNRNIQEDQQNTAVLLTAVANGAMPPAALPNWLDHRGGNAGIDAQLLSGTTMRQMQTHRGAVNEHLRHLKVEHGLTIIVRNGVYRLVARPT